MENKFREERERLSENYHSSEQHQWLHCVVDRCTQKLLAGLALGVDQVLAELGRLLVGGG